MKQSCDVIQDLLPLSIDGVASIESSALVEEHIQTCVTCQQYYVEMKQEATQQKILLDANVSQLKRGIRKQRWKQIVISFLAAVLALPLVFLMYSSFVRMEGITFDSLSAQWLANHALDALTQKDYNKAQEYLGFWGYNEDRTEMGDHLIGGEKERWLANMERFDDQYRILEANVNRSYTDDGFTQVYVDLKITDNKEIYDFELVIAYYGKHYNRPNQLYPFAIRPKYASLLHDMEPQDIEKMAQVGNNLLNILYTYNPG